MALLRVKSLNNVYQTHLALQAGTSKRAKYFALPLQQRKYVLMAYKMIEQ